MIPTCCTVEETWFSYSKVSVDKSISKKVDAIQKKGHFKAHNNANKGYKEQRKLVKHAKAALAKFDGTTSKGIGSSKKPSKKHKEVAVTTSPLDPNLQAEYQSDLEKGKKLQRN